MSELYEEMNIYRNSKKTNLENHVGMGCNRDWRSSKTRGMFHYFIKRPPNTKQRSTTSRLSHKQEMERPYSEDKHQPQSSRNCYVHNKALHNKDSASYMYILPKTSYSDNDINSSYNDVDETLGNPNHNTIVMGDINAQMGKRTNPLETATSKFGLEFRKERGDTLVEFANIKKV